MSSCLYLSVYLPVCLSVHLSVCPFVRQPVCLCLSLFACVFVCLSLPPPALAQFIVMKFSISFSRPLLLPSPPLSPHASHSWCPPQSSSPSYYPPPSSIFLQKARGGAANQAAAGLDPLQVLPLLRETVPLIHPTRPARLPGAPRCPPTWVQRFGQTAP